MGTIGNLLPKDPLAQALGFKRNLDPFAGGSTSSSSASAIDSAPVPTPQAPVTSATAEVIAAEQDLAQQNLMKKSIKKTIYAGDTGGYSVGAPAMSGYKSRTG